MKLDGAKVMVTGTFSKFSADALKAELESRGAQVVDRLAPDVQTVFAGDKPGHAYDEAMELGVRVRDAEELQAILDGVEPPRRIVEAPNVPLEEPEDYFYQPIPDSENRPQSENPAAGVSGAGDSDGPKVFEKGARVKIVGGREGLGKVGDIFWWGDSKFGDGMRAGVTADDGEKYWVDEEHLGWPDEEVPQEAVEAQAKSLGRGDEIKVISGKHTGATGTIFWWGPSKWGEGNRAGVETADGEKLWLDEAELEKIEPVGDDIPF